MATSPSQRNDLVLGIDLGSDSVGWALIARENGAAEELVCAGARVFEAGMEGDLESGQETSRNLERRTARLHRRQLWRRGRRLKKIFKLLQAYGLLPQGRCSAPDDRQNLLNDLDRAILASKWFAARKDAVPEAIHLLAYLLRAAALEENLEPHFLGRGLYHLAQRRGFRSNRKKPVGEKAKEEGEVSNGIGELRQKMEAAGSESLGQYFSTVAPTQERIRGRWTARSMYEDEFEKTWTAQSAFHPDLLTPERRKILRRAIFHQRPLKIPRNLVGRCELEPQHRRAAAYLLSSQRFRLLQSANNLKIIPPGEPECDLTEADRAKLIDRLESDGDLTFKQVRKLLGLTRDYRFNLERGGEEKIKGNRTASEFRAVLQDRWDAMSAREREDLVDYVHGFQKPETLKKSAMEKKGFDRKTAELLSEITFEPDYLSLSRKAIAGLLPLLEQGKTYAESRRALYPESFRAGEPLSMLPPVGGVLRGIRNPAVLRSLTELRKVVNAILRAHGKPAEIRIELARDLRSSRKQREASWKKGRENERARDAARSEILAGTGNPNPSSDDIRKVLLAKECHWQCPYTGKQISMRTLLGDESQFDFEHIIPLSRSLDNSFVNLTLCHNEHNRNVKHERTPFEAYGANEEEYEQILGRVKQFTSGAAAEKLRRFRMNESGVTEFIADFKARQLNDTRYATRLAADYLALLYGGRADAEHKQRVRTTLGQVTAILRNEWKLNGILQDGPTKKGGEATKSRDDHRHHAVDAIVIALTDDGTIQQLSRAAEQAVQFRRRRFAPIEAPWPDFVDSIRREIGRVIVSHRVSRKVSGPLHEETLYSMPSPQAGGNRGVRHQRVSLGKLSAKAVKDIVDPVIRERVQNRLAELGGGDPAKLLSDPKNLPCLEAADGRRIPIKSVRIGKKEPTFQLGSGRTARHVASGSNHHLEIFAELDADGNQVEWDGSVVSMAEAYRRKKAGEPVVRRDHGPKRTFLLSLSQGDVLECDEPGGGRCLHVVRAVTQDGSRTALVPVNDARQKKEMAKAGDYVRRVPDSLRRLHARKVSVGPLGEVIPAHD